MSLHAEGDFRCPSADYSTRKGLTDVNADAALKPARDGFDLSVTLVSTNERHYIEPMLPELYRAAEEIRMEVLLVDNVCTDGTADLEGRFPFLRVLRNSERHSFSWNHNRGTVESRGRYVLCLNPDVRFDRDASCIRKMVQFMDSHPDCGLSGCQVFDRCGEFAHPARRFQSLRIVLARRCQRLFGSQRVLDRYFYADQPITATFACDWLSGCFLFMRREALQETGLFDVGYGFYFEDVDICRRMTAHGWDVLYYGGAAYTHLEQRASTRLFSRKARVHLRSWAHWLGKQSELRQIVPTHRRRTALPARKAA